MATLAAGASINFFVGWGQSVRIQTTHNVSGKIKFVPQNPESPPGNSSSRSFGPLPVDQTFGPWGQAGTVYIDNEPNSAAAITYTQNLNTAYAGNVTSLAASGAVSGAGFTNYMASPPGFGTTTPGIVKTSNLQATYTDSSGTPGNVTNSSPRGRVALAAAASTIVVTSTIVTATSMIIAMVRAVDGAATDIVTATAAAGSFTITMNAATTGTACVLDFLVVN